MYVSDYYIKNMIEKYFIATKFLSYERLDNTQSIIQNTVNSNTKNSGGAGGEGAGANRSEMAARLLSPKAIRIQQINASNVHSFAETLKNQAMFFGENSVHNPFISAQELEAVRNKFAMHAGSGVNASIFAKSLSEKLHNVKGLRM